MRRAAGGSDCEHLVMTLAAATAVRRTQRAEDLARLLAVANWDRLGEVLGRARLLPTLGPRIVELAADAAPSRFGAAVAASIMAGQRQETLLELSGARVQAALTGAGIRNCGLKGPALGRALYGEPGRRLSSDVDLLVAPTDLERAVSTARELGYGRPSDHVGPNGLPLLHFALAHERGELPPVELHWRVHWYEDRFAAERLLPPQPDAGEWRPRPENELASLLLFYARDGFTGLRQATDLGAWWDRFGAGLEAGALGRVATAYPRLGPALETASLVAEQMIGVPSEATLGREARLGPRARIAVRFVDPRPYASAAQLFAEIGLIDGLLAPPGTLGSFVRRQVAPPAEVIADHAEKAQTEKVGGPLAYGIRVLGRYALAFARLLRVPFAARARFTT
jgi:Uncharacterised nucleotidyltransferase